MEETDRNRQFSELAVRILELARESILIKFRFFDTVMTRIELVEDFSVNGFEMKFEKPGRDADSAIILPREPSPWLSPQLHYNPRELVLRYKDETAVAVRLLLHVILHCLFLHYNREGKVEREYWDIATDIAVENVILSMDIMGLEMMRDNEERMILSRLQKWISYLSAEKIYREFMVGGISSESKWEYGRIFSFDLHPSQRDEKQSKEEIIISQKDFEEIAGKLSQELKSFSKDVKGKDAILLNLKESTRKRYDYDEILRVFCCNNEEIKVNPDEFDYIYYTYGMNLYKNVPLIEPLEYTDEKKIKEFVIAVDTSASVRGEIVEGFLKRTYDILERSVSFSENLLVHLIQCDSEITDDYVIRSKEELKRASDTFRVKGFGATDFRPVFEYVETLIDKREFTNLQGLIYFTDGYGIYPEKPTKYDTMFVFNSYDEFRMQPPGWAISVTLDGDSNLGW